jgi:hypothetical protein
VVDAEEGEMSKKPDTGIVVGVTEATIRILMENGFSRDEALQVMLSQIAIQVTPEVMRIGVSLCESHHNDFAKAEWHSAEDTTAQKVGSVDYALGPL